MPRHEMKSNNSSDENKAPRVPSPSFRFGSRQRPPAASTDEIVRFVREYQRCKPSPSMRNISVMKTKAVLPGIERKPVRTDVESKRSSIFDNRAKNSFDFDPGAASMNPEFGSKRTGSFELQESDPEEEDYDDNDAIYRYGRKNRASQHGMNIGSDQFDDERDLQQRLSKPEVDLEVERIFNNKGSRQKRLQIHKRGSVNAHEKTFEGFSSNRPIRQGGAMRPCALRQLPPIVNNDIPPGISRPTAPSPINTSPTVQFCSSDSCDDDNNDEEHDDGAQRNDEKTTYYDTDDSNEDVDDIQQNNYKETSNDIEDKNDDEDDNQYNVVDKDAEDNQQNDEKTNSNYDSDESNEDVDEFQQNNYRMTSNDNDNENNDKDDNQSNVDDEGAEENHQNIEKMTSNDTDDDNSDNDEDHMNEYPGDSYDCLDLQTTQPDYSEYN